MIVIYDHLGIFSVCRGAFMLRYFGATNVRIMNGGLKKWLKEGRSVFCGPYTTGQGLEADGDYDYSIVDPAGAITTVKDMHKLAYQVVNKQTETQITDARATGRYEGGNVSGSISSPYAGLLNEEEGTFKSTQEMSDYLKERGVDVNKPSVQMCGGGVTACVLNIGMRICGAKQAALHDGGWT